MQDKNISIELRKDFKMAKTKIQWNIVNDIGTLMS
jgi:hypothetical protein